MSSANIWSLVGGLGIFLFGMLVFEQTIEELGKNNLKRILGKNTNTRIKSIVTGILQTCIFQSSTIVTMMTLGFVGAGIIGLTNALGVVIGANIGTTLTPWIISLLGFKFHIEAVALPIIGIGALSAMIFSSYPKIVGIGKFLVGFGFLFLGLGYMKESVEILAHSVSLAQYAHMSIWGFVLIGMIMTTIMQTSTGATIITLTALSANLISVDMALGVVIGANMGSAISTTIVGFLSSTRTQVTKKQVAFGHFTFNIVTTILVTLAYVPIRNLMFSILGNDADPTLLLALFHTTFNIILALIWAPLLTPLTHFLKKLFPPRHTDLHLAIEHINTTLPEEIMSALRKDASMLLEKVMTYNRASLMLDGSAYTHRAAHYAELKQIEEKLLEFVIFYTKYEYTPQQATMLHTLHEAIMNATASSKYIKDVSHHLEDLRDNSLEETTAQSYLFFQKLVALTTDRIRERQRGGVATDTQGLHTHLHSENDLFIGALSANMKQEHSEDVSIAEILKSNRYILLSCEALLDSYAQLIK